MSTSAIRTPIWTVAAGAMAWGAVVCAAAGLAGSALAQPAAAPAPGGAQEITVVAPEVVRMQTSPPRMQQRRRRPVEVVSTSQPVNFADLDLSKAQDVATLRQRIKDAAREACRRLVRSAPPYRTSAGPSGCEREASMQALALVDDLAAASRD